MTRTDLTATLADAAGKHAVLLKRFEEPVCELPCVHPQTRWHGSMRAEWVRIAAPNQAAVDAATMTG